MLESDLMESLFLVNLAWVLLRVSVCSVSYYVPGGLVESREVSNLVSQEGASK